MLFIRSEQMHILRQYMLSRFEREMAVHLRGHFPKQTGRMQETEFLDTIHSGIKNAKTYGIEKRFDLKRYLEYMILLGYSFDTDQQMVWAGKILRDNAISGSDKMNRIDDYYAFTF